MTRSFTAYGAERLEVRRDRAAFLFQYTVEVVESAFDVLASYHGTIALRG